MDAAVDEQQIAALLKGVDIPPRPAILVELEKELRKDSPSTNELVRLITPARATQRGGCASVPHIRTRFGVKRTVMATGTPAPQANAPPASSAG